MSIKIGSNISSLTAQRRLGDATSSLSSIYEKLSSGQRINNASDDSAGLAIATSLNSKARVFTRGIQNLNDGISALSIADGAIEQLASITTRILELTEQGANGTYSAPQRNALDLEAQALSKEFSRIVLSTSFNGIRLFDGSVQGLRLQAGYGVEGSINSTLGGAIGTGQFGAASNFGVGSTPLSVTQGDLNGDGILDIISANSVSSNVSVLLGNGQGGFGQATNYGVGNNPQDLTLGDVNGDGVLDLVSANSSGSFSVLIGNGQGGFGAATNFAVGSAPTSIRLGDLNGDGVLDIISANGSSDSVSVLMGNGQGGFGAATNFQVGAEPLSMTLGDLNGDGILDVVTGNYLLGGVSVLLGDGQGGFNTATDLSILGTTRSVALGDLNGDGLLDLVTGGGVALGDGQGGFGTTTNFLVAGGRSSIALGDLNGDDVLDIIASNYDSGEVSVLLGNGQGGFGSATNFGVGLAPTSVTIGDLNGDGVLDIASANQGSNNVSILTGTTQSGINGILPFSLKTQADSLQAVAPIKRKLDLLNSQRGVIGAFNSRLETATKTLQAQTDQFKAAESRIKDVDVANQAGNLIRTQILQQAATSILAQANQQPQLALTLLREI